MPTSLPLEIRLIVLGILATVLLVGGAAALRGPPHAAPGADARARPAASASAARARDASPNRLASAPPTASVPRAARPARDASTLGGDGREARAHFVKQLQLGQYAAATDGLARLLDMDPKAAEDGEVRGAVVELATRVTLLTGGEPDRVFEMIATKMGATGADVLYELMTTRGGSRAAARAEELLKDAAVRARGTSALRIAYELRAAGGCEEKKALFARAKTEGDGRTLGQLQLLNQRCGRRSAGCCLQNDPHLRDTMDGIKARMN